MVKREDIKSLAEYMHDVWDNYQVDGCRPKGYKEDLRAHAHKFGGTVPTTDADEEACFVSVEIWKFGSQTFYTEPQEVWSISSPITLQIVRHMH